MQRQSDEQRKWLQNAVSTFHAALPGSPAEEHLRERGLLADEVAEAVSKYRLGYVPDHSPGFEQYAGRMAIPYLRVHPRHGWLCVGIRYRRLVDSVGKWPPKYDTPKHDTPRLYNTIALNASSPIIGICEGEIDAITGTLCGIPTVGVPGAQMWNARFNPLFEGYSRILVFRDGDETGREKFLSDVKLPNMIDVDCGDGEDLNSLFVQGGKAAVLERLPK